MDGDNNATMLMPHKHAKDIRRLVEARNHRKIGLEIIKNAENTSKSLVAIFKGDKSVVGGMTENTKGNVIELAGHLRDYYIELLHKRVSKPEEKQKREITRTIREIGGLENGQLMDWFIGLYGKEPEDKELANLAADIKNHNETPIAMLGLIVQQARLMLDKEEKEIGELSSRLPAEFRNLSYVPEPIAMPLEMVRELMIAHLTKDSNSALEKSRMFSDLERDVLVFKSGTKLTDGQMKRLNDIRDRAGTLSSLAKYPEISVNSFGCEINSIRAEFNLLKAELKRRRRIW